MELLVLIIGLVTLGLLAMRFGYDSRARLWHCRAWNGRVRVSLDGPDLRSGAGERDSRGAATPTRPR